jgi:hypothetical protein
MSDHAVVVKRDGAEVHYLIDAKGAAEAKKTVDQVEARRDAREKAAASE